MLNLTVPEITDRLAKSNERTRTLKSDLQRVEADIAKVHQRKTDLLTEQKKEEKRIQAAGKALILVQGVPAKVSQIRNRILREMEHLKREDVITVVESRNLGTGIDALKTELQKRCSHPFVYREQGYEGSPSQERENRRPEYRYCIVCGLNESGKSNGQYDYVGTRFEKLADDDNRIVEDEPWTPEGRNRVNIWLPLGAVLHPFEEEIARVLNS
ncbi:MAG: hypothetical protein A3B24_00725 [Candidatus Wildermuthbacteria bacterium RIFCSPLOWO2_01_FULL_48_16]|uniref:Uncharacterized protein n=1 Tax=Candidatus Wildermuthbacteria bacterium RIFCSPLOWO2_01_FULL_48_16 TaxID=1802461 RepID=A0A1G2RNA6_9BACT|nr:MAG: hypothetical protein A3B24_00725 [Candidatus Wildermuthbacteria bacterium RIFCSPLOWO2_01_FULL_48_16]